VYFELRRDVLQNSALVLANAVFRSAAAGALLVRLAQIMLVPIVRQPVEVEFSATATTMKRYFVLEWILRWRF
jgi:hypothetical protein